MEQAFARAREGHDPALDCENATQEVADRIDPIPIREAIREGQALEPSGTVAPSESMTGTAKLKGKASKKGLKCSDAQWNFIQTVRDMIDSGTCEDFKRRWWKIAPKKPSKCSVEDYYIRAIVAYIPHLIFPGYVPWCPTCERNDAVNVTKSFWPDAWVAINTLIPRDIAASGAKAHFMGLTQSRLLSMRRDSFVQVFAYILRASVVWIRNCFTSSRK
jgi:hypothetical protein